MPNQYIVGGRPFRTKEDVEAEIHRVLEAGADGTVLTGGDEAFALGLLQCRNDKLELIGGRKILRIERGIQPPPLKRTRCFWLVLDDGSRVDFSAYKAVAALRPSPVAAWG
jgi:hypothetical protein